MIEAVSEQNILDGRAGAFVSLHEGHLVGRKTISVAGEGSVVSSHRSKCLAMLQCLWHIRIEWSFRYQIFVVYTTLGILE